VWLVLLRTYKCNNVGRFWGEIDRVFKPVLKSGENLNENLIDGSHPIGNHPFENL
jgi:hypothetical protein